MWRKQLGGQKLFFCSALSTSVAQAIHYLWQSPNLSCYRFLLEWGRIHWLTLTSLLLFFLSSVMFVASGLADWASGLRGHFRGSVPDLRLKTEKKIWAEWLSKRGDPQIANEKRMGANGSSYPHSCSPRIGGNAQAQQTFIGMCSICFNYACWNQQSACSVTHFFNELKLSDQNVLLHPNGSVRSY